MSKRVSFVSPAEDYCPEFEVAC